MSSSDVDASFMVTTGRFDIVLPAARDSVMLGPLGQNSVIVPKVPAPSRHHGTICCQLLEDVSHHTRRHALRTSAYRGGRYAVAAQDAPRIDPPAFIANLADVHAAPVGSVQAMQPGTRISPLDLGNHALEALL